MQKIKFLTLNLFEGGNFLDKALKFFDKEKSDIMLFQEVYNGENENLDDNLRTVQILQNNFKNFYFHFAPERKDILDAGNIKYGNAIFSRFPIISSNISFYDIRYDPSYSVDKINGDYSLDPHNLQHAEINVNGTVINVFNTHGIWGLDGMDNPKRLNMSKIIIDQIKDKENVILAGDFNVKPDTKTIQDIEEHLINVFSGELKTTFNMKRKSNPGYAESVVDMIFVSNNLKILHKSCPQVDVSDHLPLICTLEI